MAKSNNKGSAFNRPKNSKPNTSKKSSSKDYDRGRAFAAPQYRNSGKEYYKKLSREKPTEYFNNLVRNDARFNPNTNYKDYQHMLTHTNPQESFNYKVNKDPRFIKGTTYKDYYDAMGYDNNWGEVDTHHNKRNILDRMFAPLMNNSAAQITYAGLTGQSKSQALKDSTIGYMNPFHDDVSNRKYWSDVGELVSQKAYEDIDNGGSIEVSPTPLGAIRELKGKNAKDYIHLSNTLGGFALDVATDPLTYLGPGLLGAGARVLKGTGRTGKELEQAALYAQRGTRTAEEIEAYNKAVKAGEEVDRLTNTIKQANEAKGVNINSRRTWLKPEDTEDIIMNNDAILADHPRRASKMALDAHQEYLKRIYGITELDAGHDYKTLDFVLSKILRKEVNSSSALRKLGDKTIAPYFNIANRKLRSTIGTIFSDNAKILRMAMKEGDRKAFDTYFSGQLLSNNYGAAKLNTQAFQSRILKDLATGDESDLVKWISEASPDELSQFAYDYEHGLYKIIAENQGNLDAIKNKAREEVNKVWHSNNPENKMRRVEIQKEGKPMKDLLEKTYRDVQAEKELRGIMNTSEGLARRKEQLEAIRSIEKANRDKFKVIRNAEKSGKYTEEQLKVLRGSNDSSYHFSEEGIKDLYRHTRVIENNLETLSRHDKDIFEVFHKSVASMDSDEFLTALHLSRDLEEITAMTGKDIDWSHVYDIYTRLHPENKPAVTAFRKAINEKTGRSALGDIFKNEISPDEFGEAIRYYRDEIVDEHLELMKQNGTFTNLMYVSPERAQSLSRTQKVLWNILHRDMKTSDEVLQTINKFKENSTSRLTANQFDEMIENLTSGGSMKSLIDEIKVKRPWMSEEDIVNSLSSRPGIDISRITDEDIIRYADAQSGSLSGLENILKKMGRPAKEGGYETSEALLADLNRFEKFANKYKDSMSLAKKTLIEDVANYIRLNADDYVNYNIDNIAKMLTQEDIQKSLSGLRDEYLQLKKEAGQSVADEIPNYIGSEYHLNGDEVAELFKLENDEARLKAYDLLSQGFNRILDEEHTLGRITDDAYAKFKNKYMPQILTPEIVENWEKVFGEPFSKALETPGKYNPVQGERYAFTEGNKFKSYDKGEKKYQAALDGMTKDKIMSEYAKEAEEYYLSRPYLYNMYNNHDYFVNNSEKLIGHYLSSTGKGSYDDIYKAYYDEISETVGKLFNYNFADVFLNKLIQHNELVQSDFANNMIKNNLMKRFDPEVGKTADKIVVPYLDVLKDCKLIKRYNKKYKNTPAEAIFEKLMTDAGIDHRLVGKNVSHFEVTESQLDTIKKELTELRNPDKTAKKKYEIATDGYNMDKTVYNMINHYTKAQMKIMQNSLLNLYDGFLTKFKILNTIINVSFHGQNMFSNAFQSFLAVGEDAFNVKGIKQAAEIVRNGDPKRMITFGGETKSAKEWRYILNQYGVVDNTFYNDFRFVADDVPEKQIRDLSTEDFNNFWGDGFKEGSKLSFLNPIIEKANKPFKAAGKAGAAIEGTQRANLFFSLVDKGHSYREAANIVDDFLFDYGNLTSVEKNLFKRVIPFYSFLRKNVPMELENMLEQPQKYANTRRTFDSISRLSEDYIPPDERNEYRDTDIQLPFRVNGKYYGLADNMPYTQFEKWSDPGKILGQTSPLVKLLPELLTGKYSYTDIPIEGRNLPEQLLTYGLNQVPALKIPARYVYDQHFGLAPIEPKEGYEPDYARGAMWGLGQTIGFPINQINRQDYYKYYGDYWADYENDPSMLTDLIEMIKTRQLPESSLLNR